MGDEQPVVDEASKAVEMLHSELLCDNPWMPIREAVHQAMGVVQAMRLHMAELRRQLARYVGR